MENSVQGFKSNLYDIFKHNVLVVILLVVLPILLYWIYLKNFSTISDSMVEEFKNFNGFKLTHISETLPEMDTIDRSKNSHFILYGSTGSGKTSFLKHYLTKNKINDFLVFGRHPNEWDPKNFIPVLNFSKVNMDNLCNKTIILDDAGAYKELKTNVEDFFRNGRHNNLQIIYLAQYTKDVLPIVRQNINKLYITLNNQDNFFDCIVQVYCLRGENILTKWQQFKNQNEFGIIELDTRSGWWKVYNQNYNLVYDSKENKFNPANYVKYESYFFTGDLYNEMKLFLEQESGQTIEITPQNIAFYYVVYCLQNGINVNVSKVSQYLSRLGCVSEFQKKMIGVAVELAENKSGMRLSKLK